MYGVQINDGTIHRWHAAIPARTATAILSFSDKSFRSSINESIIKSSSKRNCCCFSSLYNDEEEEAGGEGGCCSGCGRGLSSDNSDNVDVDSAPADSKGEHVAVCLTPVAWGGTEGGGDNHCGCEGCCCGVKEVRATVAAAAALFSCWCKLAACWAAAKCCAKATWNDFKSTFEIFKKRKSILFPNYTGRPKRCNWPHGL